ncbi:hypothetical protein [Algiphilus sp.]|uniref:hypothetical protein n=1 Tax=Algiphilus sp. TaxID=1872431 RepID=UPI0032EDCDD2|nr:hypothetical protein [Hyphomonas sp.]
MFEHEREVERYNPVIEDTQSIDQGDANVTAVGHFAPYRTHYLRARNQQETRIDGGVAIAQDLQELATFVNVK